MEGQETLVAVVLTVVMDILEQVVQILTAAKQEDLVARTHHVMTIIPRVEKVAIAAPMATLVPMDK